MILHFTEEETEAFWGSLSHGLKVKSPVSSGAGFHIRV